MPSDWAILVELIENLEREYAAYVADSKRPEYDLTSMFARDPICPIFRLNLAAGALAIRLMREPERRAEYKGVGYQVNDRGELIITKGSVAPDCMTIIVQES